MALLENEVSQRVPKVQAQTDTLTFITTEGEYIVFEGMNIPVEEAAALMGEEALARGYDLDNSADILRDGLIASGATLEGMLLELRQRREADCEH